MKLEEILPLFREGKKIRRACWRKDSYLENRDDNFECDPELIYDDLTAKDWEVTE